MIPRFAEIMPVILRTIGGGPGVGRGFPRITIDSTPLSRGYLVTVRARVGNSGGIMGYTGGRQRTTLVLQSHAHVLPWGPLRGGRPASVFRQEIPPFAFGSLCKSYAFALCSLLPKLTSGLPGKQPR